MNLSRFKTQKAETLAKNQPDLLVTVKKIFPEHADNEEQIGKITGLIIEYVIQSGGNVDVFTENVLLLEEEELEDEYEEGDY